VEAGDPLLGEPASEAADLDGGITGAAGDLGPGDLIRQEQDHPSPAAQAGGNRTGAHEPFELGALVRIQNDGTGMVGHGPSRERVYLEAS
jgi:hypothetical protein